MGTAERKEREKIRRTERIIDAAEEIIKSRGFDSATMDEIAERAELSKGALYLYFENKTTLYLAICNRGSTRLNEKFSDVLAMDLTGIELVRKLGETYLGFVNENPLYFSAFSYYESIQDPDFLRSSEFAQKCAENSKKAMTCVVRALQVGMQDGSIDDSYDPVELAITIWASSRGIVQVLHLKEQGHHFKMLNDIELNVESMFASFIQLLGNGMATKK